MRRSMQAVPGRPAGLVPPPEDPLQRPARQQAQLQRLRGGIPVRSQTGQGKTIGRKTSLGMYNL